MELRKVALLTLAVVVLLSGIALAGGWQYSGIGARAKAMGGAYRGIANDGNGGYYNPAGLAFLEMNVVNVTAELNSPRPTVTPDYQRNGYSFGYLNGQECYGKDQNYLMGEASLFFKPKKDGNLALGLAFFQGFDQNTDMNLFQLTPAYNSKLTLTDQNHRSNLDVVTWQPTIAMKFSQDRVAVGVGLQIHRGDILIDQIRLIDNPYPYPLDIRPYDKFVELYSLDGYAYGVGGQVGVQFKVSPKVTVGANYVTSAKIKMDGDSRENLYLPYNEGYAHLYLDPQANAYQREVDSTFKGAMVYRTGEFEVEMKLPSEFGVGFAYHPNDRMIVAADLVYTRWSEFQDFEIKFPVRDRSRALYPTWETLFTDVTIPFDWKDKIKLSIGLEKILNERWTYRGGYMFDQSPIPDETYNQLFLDAGTKHHFNAGVGFKLNQNVSFDAALELIVGSSRTISTLEDVNNDGYWDNVGGEFKNLSFNSTWALNYRF